MFARVIGIGCLMMALLSLVFAQATGPRVELGMIVTDKQNKSLSSIRKEDVHLFEDNVEQTILSLEADERPVDLGIAIDNSGSFRTLLKAAVDATKLFIINRRPDDQIFIERFVSNDKIERVVDFTTDTNALVKGIDTLYIEAGLSAVVDALYEAVSHVAKHNKTVPGRRKAVVIITDGEDRNSHYKTDALIKHLREQKVQVFVLGILVKLDNNRPGFLTSDARSKAEKLLKTFAEESGGRVFFLRNGKEMLDATTQIITDLQGQFRVTYQSSNPATSDPKKNFRRVEAKLTSADGEQRTAILPRGYYVKVDKKSP